MKNAHWFIFLVMLFHFSCGGTANPPLEKQANVVEDTKASEPVTAQKVVEQAEEPRERGVAKAPKKLPSDTIYLEDGTLRGYEVNLSQAGAVLAARNPGKTIITGAVSINISASNVVVRDIVFRDVYTVGKNVDLISISGSDCEISNCIIYNTDGFASKKTYYWLTIGGKRNKIIGNSFVGKENKAPLIYVLSDNENQGQHVIKQNLFARIKPLGKNGLSAIRVGLKTERPIKSGTTISENVFHECDGELEIISNKSNGNTYASNLFSNSRGGLTLRWGNDCVVKDNQFVSSANTSIGVRVAGSGHEIHNNYFDLVGGPNAAAVVFMVGSENADCGYQPVKNVKVHDNEFHGNADWKIMEHTGCGDMPVFSTSDNFKFAKGQRKGARCDYAVETRSAVANKKGSSKILNEIYEMKAMDKGGEKTSTPKNGMPDLSAFVKMEGNVEFLKKWHQVSPKIDGKRVGSTLRMPSS